MKRLSVLAAIVLSVPSALAQTWTETAYSYNNGLSYGVVIWGCTIIADGQQTVSGSVPNWWSTTGSTTTSPPWRSQFQALTTSNSSYPYSFTQDFVSGDFVEVLENFGWSNGTNSFSKENPSETASRNTNNHTTTSVNLRITPGGGGS